RTSEPQNAPSRSSRSPGLPPARPGTAMQGVWRHGRATPPRVTRRANLFVPCVASLTPPGGWHNGPGTSGLSAMTGHANSLTARATAANPAAAATMTLPAPHRRVVLDGFGRLVYDDDGLLASARLQHADFRNPDARAPCDAFSLVL